VRKVVVDVATVGQHFACRGILRDLRGRVIAEAAVIRPYGFDGNAAADAEALAESRGWESAAHN